MVKPITRSQSRVMGDFEISVGQRIRLARQRAGLTQEELAGQISRTAESISNIERGLQEPNLRTIQSLAKALNLPVSEFFDFDEKASSEERQQLEFQLRDLARCLSDRDLSIAVAQIKAFSLAK